MTQAAVGPRFVRMFTVLALVILPFAFRARAQVTFGPPAALNTNAAADAGDDQKPWIAVDGAGVWVAVWYSGDDLGGTIGTDLDVLVSRSTNNGLTWTVPALLNVNGTTDSGLDVFPVVAPDGLGNWVAAWRSTEDLGGTAGADQDIFISRSVNAGSTWSAPELLNTSYGTVDTTPDSGPRIATDGAGNWVMVWHSGHDLGASAGIDWDIFVSRSTDNGLNWSPAQVLNTNGTTDSGADFPVELATDALGMWIAVWRSDENLSGVAGIDLDIFISRSVNNGLTWTAPVLLNTNGAADTGHDGTAVIATDRAGNWVTVWHSNENLGGTTGTDWDIFASRSSDNGLTWTAPALLNSNGTSDTMNDTDPFLATDGAGIWTAVWQTPENLGGTAGTDFDVAVSHSTDNGLTWTPPALLNSNGTSDINPDLDAKVASDRAGHWVVVRRSTPY